MDESANFSPLIDWQPQPEPQEVVYDIERIVVPGGAGIKGWCLSREPLGVRVHFFRDKTIPHLKKNCPSCAGRSKHEWRCYLWLHVEHIDKLVCLDLPAGAQYGLAELLKKHHTLRGVYMQWSKKGGGLRGRVQLAAASEIDPSFSMRQSPDMAAYLQRMWKKHLEWCCATESDAGALMTPAEKERAVNPAPRGAPNRRRSPTAHRDKAVMSAVAAGEPVHASRIIAAMERAGDMLHINGDSAGAPW